MDISEILKQYMIVDEIMEKLSDQPHVALSIISMVIDEYAAKNERSSWELWEMMYDTARQVHKERGDFRNEKT